MDYRNILPHLAVLALGIALGWWLGNRTTEEVVREKVRYVTREPIRVDTELFPKWSAERIVLPTLQYHDTIREEVRIPADTAGIIADYFKQRQYELDFSTDSTGTFKVQAVIHCNRLESASATIAPLQREVLTTTREVRVFQPLAEIGVAIGNDIGLSLGAGGIIKNKHILTAKYMRLGKHNFYGGEYAYIFGK